MRARRSLRVAGTAAAACLTLVAVPSCSTVTEAGPGPDGGASPASGGSDRGPSQEGLRVRTVPARGARDVTVDTRPTVGVEGGDLSEVTLTGPGGAVEGRIVDNAWTATGRLEPGTAYTLTSRARAADGETHRATRRFTTEDLTLDDQTYASIAPLAGETVGVGMPVVVQFDRPVTDRAEFEEHLSVRSTPTQAGSWHWISDNEVRWRPEEYWKAGTEVTVDADVNSLPAGNGIYGQESRTVEFTVGSSVIHRVDVASHTMKTLVDGELARTTAISAGKAGFETRSGTKVIMEKFRTKRMDAATTGIAPGDPEYYDIDDVEYALRVTNSGEFLHAAPWSIGSQGSDNVSHGCVGMSTEDAAWVFETTKRGDVVEVTGTDRTMTVDNGWGDWNEAFSQYADGSAL